MSELKLKFGNKLRKFRRNKDLTQEQLAELLGVSVDFVSKMERGINGASFETLQKLADVLEVRVEEFFQFPQ